MELKDTVDDMLSDDYKKRVKAEYDQLKIRTGNAEKVLAGLVTGELRQEDVSCPRHILGMQIRAMKQYMSVLEKRADIEDIDIK